MSGARARDAERHRETLLHTRGLEIYQAIAGAGEEIRALRALRQLLSAPVLFVVAAALHKPTAAKSAWALPANLGELPGSFSSSLGGASAFAGGAPAPASSASAGWGRAAGSAP